jgi:photosystem II stability/assembly factor-like uncharacterized protein
MGALIAVIALALAILSYLRPWSSAPAKPLTSPSTDSFFPIAGWDFVSFTNGWVEALRPPGNTAVLYSTADAGRSWKQVRTPGLDTHPTFNLQALDSRHLLATTNSPDALWWSADGGQSWENRSPPALKQAGSAGRSRWAHFFLDAQHGWLLDSPSDSTQADQLSILWGTDNASVSWHEVWRLDPRSPEFVAVQRQGIHAALSFLDTTTGLLGIRFPDESRLYRTADGGRTWRLVGLPLGKAPLLIFLVAHTRDGAAIVITSDGIQAMATVSRNGGAWEPPRPLPDPLGRGIPFRPAILDHDHWMLALGDKFFVTNDAGQRFASFMPSVPPAHRLGTEIWFGDRMHGWADAGDSMLWSEDGGRSWKLAQPP